MKRHLLVADDEREVCDILKEYGTFKGYEVLTALDGPTVVSLVKAHLPAVVLLDIVMPGMQGLEVLKEIVKLDPSNRVIMMTAVQEEKTVREAMRLGATAYITKPIDLRKIDDVLERVSVRKQSNHGRQGMKGRDAVDGKDINR